MTSIALKVAYPIIIGGLFIIVAFIAVHYQTLNATFFSVLGLLTAYIFLFGFATGQNFAESFKRLVKRADDLSKGDVKSRLYLKNKDEIGELANIFNKIAEELEHNRSENLTLGRSVDLKVKARTQALEETINALEQKVRNRTLELQRITDEMEKLQNQLQTGGGVGGAGKARPKKISVPLVGRKKAKNNITERTISSVAGHSNA